MRDKEVIHMKELQPTLLAQMELTAITKDFNESVEDYMDYYGLSHIEAVRQVKIDLREEMKI